MKLIIATLHDSVEDNLSKALTAGHYRVTVIASTSGWLRKGMKTLLIGVEDDRVEGALKILRQQCTKPPDSQEHCATIFVLPVHEYIHF